ncbi:MAG: vitamin B12 dependent-methionine synthase activation domain-containing protein [Ruminococcus sp.]|nr:vitamin B12 dependent-methionine synthase activation domain-containing protein [Ruminococcus sp.]MDD6531782.1 vitamin B12 dependent-methionine synthase activation domain-containing protein [Ruminococcus sp.]
MITLSNLNRSEALRYMGAKALNPDKMTSDIMDEVESELLKVCRPAYTFTEIPKDSPALGGNDIKEVVAESEKVLLIAATLGIYVEKLLRKTQITNMAKAVVVDAMASVAIEQFMDKIEDELKERYKGLYFTNRFSPGYGDYPLEKQREVVKILNTEKKLGLSLSDSLLLNPTKSVTAVIGLNKNEVKGKINCTSKCMKCGNKNCPYRREN